MLSMNNFQSNPVNIVIQHLLWEYVITLIVKQRWTTSSTRIIMAIIEAT